MSMSRRLAIVAVCIGAVYVAVTAALCVVVRVTLGSFPAWAVVVLVLISSVGAYQAYYLFRRQCLWAEAYMHALRQGVSAHDAHDVATRYVDICLPWGRRTPDQLRVLREADELSKHSDPA
jgi:hypothetical protein